MNTASKRVICIGGGHCNCQVLKLLKKLIVEQQPGMPKIELTLVSDSAKSYYSGMLPGSISGLYKDEDIMVHLEPLAKWCKADWVKGKVVKIEGNANKIHLENGETLDYDVLAINVGSKTRDTNQVKGVWDHALTTRPINDLLPKIAKREQELKAAGIIPEVVVCGSGAAGTEMSFAFKKRWSAFFGQEIKVTLLGPHDKPVSEQHAETRKQIIRKLEEKKIPYIGGVHIKEVTPNCVILDDGRELPCDVAVWATGAEPQGVSAASDLDLMKGFFRVNNFLQSTSHPNIFAGGDCITMESYVDKPYPTKAGVYAVRAGPFIAKNIVNFIEEKPLEEYVPQTGFLSLMMTGDGNSIGSKFGIAFVGKWVWELKDYIDMSFMDLFNPKYLFKDYETKGTAEPIENYALFDDEAEDKKKMIAELKAKADAMDGAEAAKILGCEEEEVEFHMRWQILTRMHWEEDFRSDVIAHFKPPYYTENK